MKKLMNSLRAFPMRRKLFCYGMLFILAFFIVCAVLLTNLNNVSSEYDSISTICDELKQGSISLQNTHQLLSGMIAYASEERIADFFQAFELVELHYCELSFPIRDYETYYIYHDILNMLDSYGSKSAQLVDDLIGRPQTSSSISFSRLNDIVDNIVTENERLIVRLYGQIGDLGDSISRQILLFNICLPVFSVFIVIYSIGLLAHLNHCFVNPIRRLTDIAKNISRGEYPREKLTFREDSEFNILSESMYSMSTTIRENIEEISNRAQIMQELNTQQIENLRIKSMYSQLELRRLQEQINPHFLFNCLSTLHHTAYLENAQKTCEICSAIASLLRYNFRQCDATVTLERELDNLANFIYLQDIRFGSRISVSTDIEPGLPVVHMPRMILQPIVENCYRHGLNNINEGGKIEISIRDRQEYAQVHICDNGVGMPQEKLDQLCELFEEEETDLSNHAHIGMLNVVRRLQGFYGRKDVIDLSNEIGLCVTIRLFYRRKVEPHGEEQFFRVDRG